MRVIAIPDLSFRHFWERVIDGPIGATFLAGKTREAEAALAEAIDRARNENESAPGMVHLVGAGPGDPDLLTLRALHVLQSADVIFHDELVGPEILSRARRDAEQVFVGKRKGAPGLGQAEINRRLIEAAKQGRCVVRLKGGDPFHLRTRRRGTRSPRTGRHRRPCCAGHHRRAGLRRGSRTAADLSQRGYTADAGHGQHRRGCEQRRLVGTGRSADDRRRLHGPYIGRDVRAGLINAGRSPQTPVAVLARGTRPDAAVAVGRLEYLPGLAASVGEGPALLVIGDVVARSEPWKISQIELQREAA